MKKIFICIWLISCGYIIAQPTIKKVTNNNVLGHEITDGEGIYFIPVNTANLTKSEIEQRDLAIAEYVAIKEKESLPKPIDLAALERELIQKELGSPEDQLEMIYNDMVNGTTNWRDKRTEIKNRIKNK